jgi:hypothetical protein
VRKLIVGVLALASLFVGAQTARAQSRPLVTEDPETVPVGNILFEAGFDITRNTFFPASGLTGTLWRIGTFGFSFGISPIAEIQLDAGLLNRLTIDSADPEAPLADMLTVTGSSTSDFEDVRIGAKVRVLSETESRPAIAIRFSTRLPNAGNESGLGLDTTDFHFGFLGAKTVQSIRFAGNFGFGILGDPIRGDRQNDVVDYGLSVARAVRTGIELVAELNGQFSSRSGDAPVGTGSRSMVRFGGRVTRGPVRLDSAVLVGVTSDDPSWGITFGMTWVFKAFNPQ